ncbi:MAG: glycosyltransferase family 9 protein [Rhodospirillaceae bacterium]
MAKVLFITSNRLGDAVLSTGVLGRLTELYPEARFTVACGPVAAPLFRALPGLDRVIPFGKRRWSAHWVGLWARCAGDFWHLVVDLRNSAVSRLLPARRRIIASRLDETCHRVEHLAVVLGQERVPAPRLWFADADRAAARALIPEGGPVLALGPAANWRGKTWRAERFAALIAILTGPAGLLPGARVAVLAAEGEREQARPVLEAIAPSRRIDLVGRTDPLVAGACLERCALFIGNDSGLMHIAAAVGIPTLGLFGPSRPEHYAPWGRHCAVAGTAIPYRDLVWGPGYDPKTTDTLMDSLAIETVVTAAGDLWRRSGR